MIDQFLMDPWTAVPYVVAVVSTLGWFIHYVLHKHDADLLRGTRRKLQQEVSLRNEVRRDLSNLEKKIDLYSESLLNKKPEKRPATSKTFEEAGRKLQRLLREMETADD